MLNIPLIDTFRFHISLIVEEYIIKDLIRKGNISFVTQKLSVSWGGRSPESDQWPERGGDPCRLA
jgi:hypothetical protein